MLSSKIQNCATNNNRSKVFVLSLAAVALAIAFLMISQDFRLSNAATVSSRKPKNELANGQNCTDHVQIIDRCSSQATYSYTTDTNQYPNNTDELKQSCDRIVEGVKCLKIYGKCMKPIGRRTLASYTNARSRHSKKLCANLQDPKAQNFAKIGECLGKANKKSAMVAAERDLISVIQVVSKSSTLKFEERLHSACCAAANYKSKALKDMDPECSKYKEAQEDMLNSMIGELLETACPDQAKLNDVCTKLPKLTLPKEWKAASLTGAALDLILVLAD